MCKLDSGSEKLFIASPDHLIALQFGAFGVWSPPMFGAKAGNKGGGVPSTRTELEADSPEKEMCMTRGARG